MLATPPASGIVPIVVAPSVNVTISSSAMGPNVEHTDGANTYTYNAAGVGYTYDGDGNRLEKCTLSGSACQTVTKLYWYGAGTEILDESDASGNFTNEYVFFGGRRVAQRNVSTGTIYYYEADMLGSSRTIVQAGGTSPCFDADFRPFGSELDVTNSCTPVYKFEGKERDTETGNDDFGARYYTFRLGRWLSADWSSVPAPVPYANLTNPQTLNLYAMVSDDPESFADLDGHQCVTTAPGGTSCKPDVQPNAPGKTGEGFPAPQTKGTGTSILDSFVSFLTGLFSSRDSNPEPIATDSTEPALQPTTSTDLMIQAGTAATNAVPTVQIQGSVTLGPVNVDTNGNAAAAIPPGLAISTDLVINGPHADQRGVGSVEVGGLVSAGTNFVQEPTGQIHPQGAIVSLGVGTPNGHVSGTSAGLLDRLSERVRSFEDRHPTFTSTMISLTNALHMMPSM
jgi:RHS repeat-associated protein